MPATGIANVGNSESNNLDEVEVYPNPTNQSFVISHLSLVNTIEMRNLLGQPVKKMEAIFSNDLRIDTHDLPNGIYFLTISNQSHIRTIKVVKNAQ